VFERLFYVAVAAGMALGTSSFLMLAGAFSQASLPVVLFGVLIAAGICVALSRIIAEMASMFPTAPGVRTYIKQGLGNNASLYCCFLYIGFVLLAAGVEAYIFALVVHRIVPWLPASALAVTLIWTIAGINLLGITPGRRAQVITTGLLALFVLGLGAAGTFLGTGAGIPGDISAGEFASLPAVAGICIFLFVGFEWVTPLGFGPKSYRSDIPRAMPLGIGLNTLLYLVLILGLAQVLPATVIGAGTTPQVMFGNAVFGSAGGLIILFVCVVATASTFNAGVMGGARLVYALAREGNLPTFCRSFSVERGVPRGAILLLASLATVTGLLIGSFNMFLPAAIVASTLACIVYAALVFSGIRLRQQQPKRRRPFRTRLGNRTLCALALTMIGVGLASLTTEIEYLQATVSIAILCATAAGIGVLLVEQKRRSPTKAAAHPETAQ